MITLKGTLYAYNDTSLKRLECELGCFTVLDERFDSLAAGQHPGFFEIEKIEQVVTCGSGSHVELNVVASLKHFSLQAVSAKPSGRSSKRRGADNDSQLSLLDKETSCEPTPEPLTATRLTEAETDVEELPPAHSPNGGASPSHQPLTLTAEPDQARSTLANDTGDANAAVLQARDEATTQDAAATGSALSVINAETTPLAAASEALTQLEEEITLDSTLPRTELAQAVARLKASGYQFDKMRQVWLRPR